MDEALRTITRQFQSGRKRVPLSTARIVFLVVAAAAPLAAMVGNVPLALARGNGAGAPGAFLFAALVLLCFAVGYAAIGRRIVNTGAFYTYVVQGLGKPLGVSAAFVALVAYLTFTVGLAASFGYFMVLVTKPMGMDTSWLAWALGGAAIVATLGYRSIDLSSKVLGALMVGEIGILLAFDVSVLVSNGPAALPLSAFSPDLVFGPGLGVTLALGFTSFIGFESAALYGEEAAKPTRSIPIATYTSVVLIGLFYLVTVWLIVGAIGSAQVHERAAADGGMLVFSLFAQYGGQGMADVMGLLVGTSMLACYLAIHNAATRYAFALSRDKLLPPAMGRFHPTRYAPSNASATVTAVSVGALVVLAASGIDPYKVGVPVLIGLGTLGIIILQGVAAVAVFAYFLVRREGSTHTIVLVASGLGAIGLLAATVLVTLHFKMLAATDLPGLGWLPTIYLVTAVLALGFAWWLRKARPKVYGELAQIQLRADTDRPMPAPAQHDKPYCIVGAGPSGLLAARAFRLAGVPFDHFERHSDVGGIWDIDNPGSSMYESAHFISSKYTSGFFGLPMPSDYPDYPSYGQILAYIKRFADAFDLRRSIRFGVSVLRAEPLGKDASEGWIVALSTGEVKGYRGIVCANGVTWHPSMPKYPGQDLFQGELLHTVNYRSASSLQGKRVLIVGCGNSGVDIACDAARSAKSAHISLRRGYHFVPKHLFGIPTDVFISGQVQPPKGVVIPDDPSQMLQAMNGDITRYGLPAPDHKVLESHPIMNTQILHYLGHGDLKAKGEIKEFTRSGVVFADGSKEDFDLVMFATGYEYRIPYIDEKLFTWKQGHPDLYLNMFHRELRGLSVVGFVEFASAGYQRFDEMAQMAAMDAHIEASPGAGRDAWRRMKAEHRPNLRGKIDYVDSPRHANYVEVGVYRRILAEIREKFGWPDASDALYASMRVEPKASGLDRSDAEPAPSRPSRASGELNPAT
jgi:amino acid transporter